MSAINSGPFWVMKSHRLSNVERKAYSFLEFEPHWGAMKEGDVIQLETVKTCVEIFYTFRNMGFESFETQPGFGGEVWLSAIRANYELEVVVNSDLLCELYITAPGVYEDEFLDLNIKQLHSKIRELDFPWSSSEFSTPSIMTTGTTKNDSLEWHLDQVREEYQSSIKNAPLIPVDQSVGTLKRSMAN